MVATILLICVTLGGWRFWIEITLLYLTCSGNLALRIELCAPGVQARGVGGDSQREMKTCSAGMVVRGPEPAAVGLNNRSADTKPHAGAVFLSGKESVKYLACLVRGKSD